jgi:hypothetical protein
MPPTDDEIRRTEETKRVLKEAVDKREAEQAAKQRGDKPK